ncbi:MAG: hypothetical protein WA913_01565 [Pricia sp.]
MEIEFGTLGSGSNFNEQDIKGYSSSERYSPISPQFTISDNTIVLEGVEVKAPKIRDRFQINASTEGRIVTDSDIKKKVTLANYLRGLGFRTSVEAGKTGSGLVVRSRLPAPSGGHPKIPISVGGMFSDGTDILGMPLSNVQSIVFDADKSIFLAINLRQGHYVPPNAPKNHIKYLISEGYASPKEYETAKYPLFDDAYDRYKAIDWNPKISINNDSGAIMTFPKSGQNEVSIFLEGMGTDGTLISSMKTIKLN